MKKLVTAFISLWVTIGLLTPVTAHAQQLLGTFVAGERITVEIESAVAPTLLKLFIDGEEVEFGWRVIGSQLHLLLPQEISGQRHDLVLVLDKPGAREVFDAWVFDTPVASRELFISMVTEAGAATSGENSDTYTSAAGRLDFGLGDGRFIGGASFGYPDMPGIKSPAELSVFDLFLEYRGAIFGDELRTRMGTHYVYNDTNLIDDATRRGLSLRLDDLSNRYQIAAFALAPTMLEGTENLSGLENPDDLVVGSYGYIHPFDNNSLRLSFAGYQGNSATTPDGLAGTGEGYGVTLSGPITRRVDYAIGVETTSWETDGGANTGTAILAEFAYELLPDDQRNLGLSVDLRWVDQDHYSFLNPTRIAGEQGVDLGLHYYATEWQWQIGLGYAETNYHGDSSAPTDALGALSFEVFYLPDDFTGGFLNGTTFYAIADILTQDRLITPVGSADPMDNTLYSFIVGFDKFHRDYSFAASYRHDILDDRTALDEDELDRRVEFLYAATPSVAVELGLRGEVGYLITTDGSYWDGSLGLSVRYEIVPDALTWETELGLSEFENPTLTDGGYFVQNLLWEFAEGHNLILSAQYGRGPDVPDLVGTDDGWSFGLALQSKLDFSRIR